MMGVAASTCTSFIVNVRTDWSSGASRSHERVLLRIIHEFRLKPHPSAETEIPIRSQNKQLPVIANQAPAVFLEVRGCQWNYIRMPEAAPQRFDIVRVRVQTKHAMPRHSPILQER